VGRRQSLQYLQPEADQLAGTETPGTPDEGREGSLVDVFHHDVGAPVREIREIEHVHDVLATDHVDATSSAKNRCTAALSCRPAAEITLIGVHALGPSAMGEGLRMALRVPGPDQEEVCEIRVRHGC
jgi:hypothetical protein